MKIYNYDANTKEFVSESLAHESPLEPGVFLVPANATKEAPPKVGQWQIPVFTGNGWTLTGDYRQATVYSTKDGKVHEVTSIGRLSEDLTLTPRPSKFHHWANNAWVEDKEGSLNDVVNSITNYRDRLKENNGILVDGKWYQSDIYSRATIFPFYSMGANVPAYQWQTMDGTFVTITQYLVSAILTGYALSDIAINNVAQSHIENVTGSTTPDAYDWSTGWPAGYTPAP